MLKSQQKLLLKMPQNISVEIGQFYVPVCERLLLLVINIYPANKAAKQGNVFAFDRSRVCVSAL